MNTRRYIVMLTAAVAPIATWCANADSTTDDPPRIVVSLAGFDLASQKGADAMYRRIQSAAKIVCRVNESREQPRIARARACYRSAIDDAVAQANRPLLSEVHARRTSSPEDVIRSASR
jgi:UrcA family protein